MATRSIVPRADSEGGLGTALKRWASAFINALTVNTIALIGGQIAFPATQAPSSDVNTLDDYEEGAWTFNLQFGGNNEGITYAAGYTQGYYTKVGRKVHCTGLIALTSKGSSVGSVEVHGLPFTVANDNKAYGAVSLRLNNVSFANFLQGLIIINSDHFTLEEITEAGVRTALTNTDFNNDSTVAFCFTYVAA